MSYKKCHKCKEYHFDYEPCPSVFIVYHDQYLDEAGKQVRGDSFEDAAERYAQYYNQNDYDLLHGEEIEIEVESLSGERKRFKCGAEPSIYYNINEIK